MAAEAMAAALKPAPAETRAPAETEAEADGHKGPVAEVGTKRDASEMTGDVDSESPAKKAAAASNTDPNLPAPWQAHVSQGFKKTYWYNPETKENTWIHPGHEAASPAPVVSVGGDPSAYAATPKATNPRNRGDGVAPTCRPNSISYSIRYEFDKTKGKLVEVKQGGEKGAADEGGDKSHSGGLMTFENTKKKRRSGSAKKSGSVRKKDARLHASQHTVKCSA